MCRNSRTRWYLILLTGLLILTQCRAGREMIISPEPEKEVIGEWEGHCPALDTIRSFLITKAEALMTFDNERYEVTLTLYSRKDSILYLSAVNSGYEIIRASADHDTVRVIDRMNKVVYRTPLHRQFGYQFPVDFNDLQRICSVYYLCGTLEKNKGTDRSVLELEFDQPLVKKRITVKRDLMQMDLFEFYHQRTGKYLMGERVDRGFKIYANLMINEFEVIASRGTVEYNRVLKVKMDVNPKRYTYIDLQ
jgi:hypothetical protein